MITATLFCTTHGLMGLGSWLSYSQAASPYLPRGAQPLSPSGQFLTLGVARTPGVFHAASYSCEFDLDGDEDDLREHCSCFCFDRGWVHHFLQHQGANLAFVCIVNGQYHCVGH